MTSRWNHTTDLYCILRKILHLTFHKPDSPDNASCMSVFWQHWEQHCNNIEPVFFWIYPITKNKRGILCRRLSLVELYELINANVNQTLYNKNTSSDKALIYVEQKARLVAAQSALVLHHVKPAKDKHNCSTKCHLWHIIRGSKCSGSCFRNKLLTAADDETEQIPNYSRTPQNQLNLLQPGASPSPSCWQKDRKKVRRGANETTEKEEEKQCRCKNVVLLNFII